VAGRRSARDQREERGETELFDTEKDWLDDDGTAPPVLD
jgi:uncharacterized protein YciU (UPF0263 family)